MPILPYMSGWKLRTWRRIRVAPGVTLNLSNRGVSTSIGPRGAHVTLGRNGVRETVGIPGTGLFLTKTIPRSSAKVVQLPRTAPAPAAAPANDAAAPPASTGAGDVILVILAAAIGMFALVVFLAHLGY
jgi:Protein of unknown function (DUF4236)